MLGAPNTEEPADLFLCCLGICNVQAIVYFNAAGHVVCYMQIGRHHSTWLHIQEVRSRWHLSKIAVLAGAFLFSVVLNNMALKYIPVSFVEVMSSPSEPTDCFAIHPWMCYVFERKGCPSQVSFLLSTHLCNDILFHTSTKAPSLLPYSGKMCPYDDKASAGS